MNGERLDELQADAQHLLFTAESEYIKDFAARVIQLCEAYGRSRAALEAVTKENARLRDTNYDLLSLRHGSLSPRVSSVVPQESE